MPRSEPTVLLNVPFIYELPDDGGEGSCWVSEILGHEPEEISDDDIGPKVDASFFVLDKVKPRIGSGRLRFPLDVRGLRSLASAGTFQATTTIFLMDGLPLPVAGMTSAFLSVSRAVPIVPSGRHAGLPARDAALFKAREIAACIVRWRGSHFTSSYEPMISMGKPAKGKTGVVFRDVHGLWRHPHLRLRSSANLETPLVGLKAAQEEHGFSFSAAARKAGIADADLSGYVSRMPEADMAVYDVMRDVSEYLPDGAGWSRHCDPDAMTVVWKAEEILDLYEDASSPLPPARCTANLLRELRFVCDDGTVPEAIRIGYRNAMDRFDRWCSMRGFLLDSEAGPEAYTAFENDEAIASFRM